MIRENRKAPIKAPIPVRCPDMPHCYAVLGYRGNGIRFGYLAARLLLSYVSVNLPLVIGVTKLSVAPIRAYKLKELLRAPQAMLCVMTVPPSSLKANDSFLYLFNDHFRDGHNILP